jgi:uncharacterized membrane protein YbhN (UPF0104 family)
MPVYHRAHEASRAVVNGDDEPAEPERHLASRIFNLAIMVVGGIALWWMLRHLGGAEFFDVLRSLGWWFAVVVALDLVSLCMDAAALNTFMRPEARMISYWRVLGAQASGRAINVLTPGGALGEATKLSMLVSRAPKTRVLSSLVLLNLTQVYLSVIIMIIGTPIMFLLVDVPHTLKVTIAIGFAVLIPLMIVLGIAIHRGATRTLVGLVRRTRLISAERADSWKTRLVDVDRHIRELHRNRSAGTWKGILWVLGSKIVSSIAAMTLIHNAGITLSPALVIGTLSVGLLITWVSSIIPMGLGLAEGGNYALFDLVGATGAYGMVITMLNRGRSVIVAILGLCAMATMNVLNKLEQARINRKLHAMRERLHAQ